MADPLTQAKKLAAYNNQLYRQNWQTNANFNAAEAQKNRDWQERMANSAHQREIADLKAAGLNPVLSVTGGNGAPTGSGSAASAQQAPVDTSMTNAVIDLATTQMNNATRLQEMAMQTTSAQLIANLNNRWSMAEHLIPGGNTPVGQTKAVLNDLLDVFSGNSGKSISDYNAMILADPGKTDIDELLYELTDGKQGKKATIKSRAKRALGSDPVVKAKKYYEITGRKPKNPYKKTDIAKKLKNNDFLGSIVSLFKKIF